MSDQAVLLPKWSPNGRMILAKGHPDHSILFELWLIMIFSPVANFAQQSLGSHYKKALQIM